MIGLVWKPYPLRPVVAQRLSGLFAGSSGGWQDQSPEQDMLTSERCGESACTPTTFAFAGTSPFLAVRTQPCSPRGLGGVDRLLPTAIRTHYEHLPVSPTAAPWHDERHWSRILRHGQFDLFCDLSEQVAWTLVGSRARGESLQ